MIIGQGAKLDPLQPVVAEVVTEILTEGPVVAPLEVLLRLEVIEPQQVEAWRSGGLPYLERGITAGLSRVSRLLRLIREHCLSLGLTPTQGKYKRKGKKQPLRFSKRGDEESEHTYSVHYVRAAATQPPDPL